MEESRTKSENFSIRLDPNVRSKLNDESIRKKISTNLLINQILEDHVNWTEKVDQHRAIITLRPFFKEILDAVDRQKLIQISRTVAKDDLQKFIEYAYGNLTFDILIEELIQYLQKINLNFKGGFDKDHYSIMITHDLGNNWPYFITNVYDELFSEIGYCVTDEVYHKEYFTFKIVKIPKSK